MAEKKLGKVVLSDEEYKIFQKMTEGSSISPTVIRVGNDKQTEEHQLEQYKEINKDLRRKVAIAIKEKACLQADVDRLKLIAEENDDGLLSLMTGMEREINSLKKENSAYSDMSQETSGLKSKIRDLEYNNKKLEEKLSNEISNRDTQIEELTIQNEELQKELDIRILEDDRFKNMEL